MGVWLGYGQGVDKKRRSGSKALEAISEEVLWIKVMVMPGGGMKID